MFTCFIDESVIYNGISSYGINDDLNLRGVDLEEADGAQDIGFISLNFLMILLQDGSVIFGTRK